MNAIVKKYIEEKDIVIFETEQGFGWFETCGIVELEENDILIGTFDNFGSENIIREATGETIDAYIDDLMIRTYEEALEKIFK